LAVSGSKSAAEKVIPGTFDCREILFALSVSADEDVRATADRELLPVGVRSCWRYSLLAFAPY
jgi:hypothetical protein